MSNEIVDLATLLNPISIDTFIAEYWETKPLHIQRREKDYFKNLLSGEDLENIISRTDMRYPAIRLANHGGFYPPEAYTANQKYGDDFFNGIPDVDRIFSEYRSGATVTLPALHRTWEPLKDLCAALETYFDHVVNTNAYITPGNASGFTPHYDTHEVFVLQLAGKKHWRVYEPPITLPHRSQQFSPHSYDLPSAPLLEIELNAGELLYLPRGYVHAATTTTSYSAHISIGITVYTWVELAAELLKSCKETTRYRRALPPGFASHSDLKQNLKQGLSDLVDELQKFSDYDELIELFSERVKGGRSRSAGAFHCDVMVIGPRTALKAPEKREYRVSLENGNIILKFRGKSLAMSPHVRPTLDAICDRKSFQSVELPGHIDANAKLALVRHLYKEGFLSAVD